MGGSFRCKTRVNYYSNSFNFRLLIGYISQAHLSYAGITNPCIAKEQKTNKKPPKNQMHFLQEFEKHLKFLLKLQKGQTLILIAKLSRPVELTLYSEDETRCIFFCLCHMCTDQQRNPDHLKSHRDSRLKSFQHGGHYYTQTQRERTGNECVGGS